VKLEICSGKGEWAVEQALADQGRANWVTCELRQHRVYQTFSRAVFRGAAHNLAIVGGDAVDFLANRVVPEQVSAIFVNHPEPPQQRQWDGENAWEASNPAGGKVVSSEAAHLLQDSFFLHMHRVLRKRGTLCIVTDNSWYARLLLNTCVSLVQRGLFTAVDLPTGKQAKREVEEEKSGVRLFVGEAGRDCGHSNSGEESSSYFDRLWKADSNFSRYILCLEKN